MKMSWFVALTILAMPVMASSQYAPPPPERTEPWLLPVVLQLESAPNLAKFYTKTMRERVVEGVVEVDLRVNSEGKVMACEVKTPATATDLAKASCLAAYTARYKKSLYGASAMPLKFVWSASGSQVVPARPGHAARLASPPFSGEFSYPADAMKKNETGRVVADIDVAADGRPIACRIRRSSGSISLDDATCEVMMKLGRFEPAVDVFGAPLAGTANGSLNWTLQQDEPPSSPSKR